MGASTGTEVSIPSMSGHLLILEIKNINGDVIYTVSIPSMSGHLLTFDLTIGQGYGI